MRLYRWCFTAVLVFAGVLTPFISAAAFSLPLPALPFDLYWSLIALLEMAQIGIIILLVFKLKSQKKPPDDSALVKTKYQLRREIARHETTEELLLETREYLNGLINSLPAVVIGVTDDGDVTHWNTAAELATGLSQVDALGQKLGSVLRSPSIPVEQIRRTIQTRTPHKREAIALGQGSDTSFCDLTIQPLISPESSGAVVLIQDVTLRVRVERSMIQNEKMMSLGKMAAGLAHEINNPLAAILNNIQTMERRLTARLDSNLSVAEANGLEFSAMQRYMDQREITRMMQDTQSAGERAALIVKTMLEFSHAYQSTFEPIDMASLVDRSLELAANTIGLKAESDIKMPFVIRDFNATTPRVACSPSEIQQVLLNLLLNAAQAIHYAEPPIKNPTLTVRLNYDQQYVIIEVEDNGPGMNETVQKHIFEPFFTTKEVGSGTGLGLSVSYFIINDHHQGHIEVRSKQGIGTNFIIKLPLQQILQRDKTLGNL